VLVPALEDGLEKLAHQLDLGLLEKLAQTGLAIRSGKQPLEQLTRSFLRFFSGSCHVRPPS
jgi:hypothetical protein